MGLDDRQFAADDRIPKRNGGVGVGARVENHAVGPLAGVMEGIDQRARVVRLDVTQRCASLGGDGGERGDDVVERVAVDRTIEDRAPRADGIGRLAPDDLVERFDLDRLGRQ